MLTWLGSLNVRIFRMISFEDAMVQIDQFLEDFPTMQNKQICDSYLNSLIQALPESKAEQLGKAVWCLYLVENCKQQIEQLLAQDELSVLQKYEWTAIKNKTVMAGSVFINVITSHVQHLQAVHNLQFNNQIQNIQDQTNALLALSETVIHGLPEDGATLAEIGQNAVLEIGRTILD